MAAVQQTIDQVRRIDVDQYKYGFETDIESVKAPKGLDERYRPLHLRARRASLAGCWSGGWTRTGAGRP